MKQNIKKKLLCAVLAASTLLLPACGGTAPAEESSSADESTEAPAESIAVPENTDGWIAELDNAGGKYSGQSASIISVSGELFQNEEENPLARAVTRRNELVQQYMGVSASCEVKKADEVYSRVKVAFGADTACADLICAPVSVLSRLAAEGMLENLYSLPYLDLDAPYIDKTALAQQTVGDTLYFYSGPVTNSANSAVGVFFNRKLAESAGVDLFALAKSGGFTWDALKNAASAVSAAGADGIAVMLDDTALSTAIYGSSGRSIFAANGGVLERAADAAAAEKTAAVIEELFKNPDCAVVYGKDEAAEAFKKGRLGFVVATLDCASLFEGAESEWGLLPLPKHSEAQKSYSSLISGSALALAVPRGSKDSGFSGFLLNALLAASAGVMEEALKTTYVNYYFWSNDAAVMLNTVCATAGYDLGVLYGGVPALAAAGVYTVTSTEEPEEETLNEFKDVAGKMFH